MRTIIFFVLIFSPLLAKDITLLPKSNKIIDGELNNGFKYTIYKNQKPKNWVEMKLLIEIGSLEERDNQRGLAHFIEILRMKGQKRKQKRVS